MSWSSFKQNSNPTPTNKDFLTPDQFNAFEKILISGQDINKLKDLTSLHIRQLLSQLQQNKNVKGAIALLSNISNEKIKNVTCEVNNGGTQWFIPNMQWGPFYNQMKNDPIYKEMKDEKLKLFNTNTNSISMERTRCSNPIATDQGLILANKAKNATEQAKELTNKTKEQANKLLSWYKKGGKRRTKTKRHSRRRKTRKTRKSRRSRKH